MNRRPSVLIILTLLVFSLVGVMLIPFRTHAATLVVTNTNDFGAGSLRDTIAIAASGDTITFAPGVTGTITLTAPLVINNKSLTITGPGAANLTISGVNRYNVFTVTYSGINVAISDLTIANGKATNQDAGAIYAPGLANLTLSNIVVTGNSGTGTSAPGGINSYGQLTINNSTFSNNTGGVLSFQGKYLSVNNSTFTGNSSQLATLVLNQFSDPQSEMNYTIANSTFSGNSGSAASSIHLGGSKLTVINTTFSGNSTTNGTAGAIYNGVDATLTIIGSTFSTNTIGSVPVPGFAVGAIFNDSGATLLVANSTFSSNTVPSGNTVGAIYNRASATILNTTIANNSGSLGGIFNDDGSLTLKNSIIANNTAANCTGSLPIDGGHNIQYPGTNCGSSIQSANPLLGTLLNNGGPTKTRMLGTGSPAIDRGDNAVCTAWPVNNLDQRGLARPISITGYNTCDIGAVELWKTGVTPTATLIPSVTPVPSVTPSPTVTPTLWAPITVNTLSDTDDGVCNSTHCSLREAVAQVNSGGTINFSVTGTIVLNSQLLLNKNMTISGPGAALMTLDGNNTNRIFYLQTPNYNGGMFFTISISNLTLQHGYADADDGGAIYNNYETLNLTNVVLTDNHVGAGYRGGAIFASGPLNITSSTLQNNTAGGFGGALAYFSNSPGAVITTSTLRNNSAGDSGGAIWTLGSTSDIRSSTFQGNSAGRGGAIWNDYPPANTTISNSTFQGNRATFGGGGAIGNYKPVEGNVPAAVVITNSTFADNTANTSGGNLYNDVGVTLTLKNTILTNSGTGGNCAGTISNGGYNLQYPGADCGAGITTADPKLLALGNNGGLTETMALQTGSPAIDAGSATVCSASPVSNVDQRGNSRPVDGDGIGGSICDIGAFEVSPPTVVATVTPSPLPTGIPTVTPTSTVRTVTKLADTNDGVCNADCSLREALAVSWNGDTIKFATGLSGTILLGSTIQIDRNVTISGPGANLLTISGNKAVLIFTIPSATVTMSKVTLASGKASGYGAAVSNGGKLTLSMSAIMNNASTAYGGAIYNTGTLTITRSTLSGNNAPNGAALFSYGGSAVISNSTIANNTGGGSVLYAIAGAKVTLTNVTVASNNQRGLNNPGATITLKNTIVANNGTSNCAGTITDGGNNLQYPGTSCGATITVGDPVLGALASNGGTTMTMQLMSGSAAIDMGSNVTCSQGAVANVDERGTVRPIDGNSDGSANCDIGAYEAAAGTSSGAPIIQQTVSPTETQVPTFVPPQP